MNKKSVKNGQQVISLKNIAVLLLFIFSFPHSLAAAEIHQFAMYHSGTMVKEDCALVERYSTVKDEAKRFPGMLTGEGCEVVIPEGIYEKQFSFCYLAGFNFYKTPVADMTECFIQKRGNEYSFLATTGDSAKNGQIMCYFSCIGNEEK